MLNILSEIILLASLSSDIGRLAAALPDDF